MIMYIFKSAVIMILFHIILLSITLFYTNQLVDCEFRGDATPTTSASAENVLHEEGKNALGSGDKNWAAFLTKLRSKDTCGTIYFSKRHGFDLREYKVITKDNYVIKLHRLIHPSDILTDGPKPGSKKPYLLLHGLIGSSASFLRNIDLKYKPPGPVYNTKETINEILNFKSDSYEHNWQSVADKFNASFDGDKTGEKRAQNVKQKVNFKYSTLQDLDYDADTVSFAREFKQAYRKYEFTTNARPFISNSLALTLSNFGYDVWLINFRGNAYSQEFNGPLNTKMLEYWNFDIEKLVREDLLASINKIKSETEWTSEPMGLISYSYTSLHVLNLLTKFQAYQTSLQPVIMMAPTLLNPSAQSSKFKNFMKVVTKTIVANNGPFPELARSKDQKIERLICHLPVASSLCRIIETLLYGRSKSLSLSNMLINDQETWLIKHDTDCGQTSTAVLHQIIDNLSKATIDPKYIPYVSFRSRIQRGEKPRRSVMLIHSETDKIATPFDIEKIRDTALKAMTLVDLNIKEPNFDHPDFLFSKKNQYLVNAEITRMAIVFDFLLTRPSAHELMSRARGF